VLVVVYVLEHLRRNLPRDATTASIDGEFFFFANSNRLGNVVPLHFIIFQIYHLWQWL
jgi:hypothetical protein